jgi:hypothetical protein
LGGRFCDILLSLVFRVPIGVSLVGIDPAEWVEVVEGCECHGDGCGELLRPCFFWPGRVEICGSQAGPAGAPGQPLRLTLKQAVQLALKQNPQVVVARFLTMESGQQQQIARAGLLPQANLTAATALEQYNFQSVECLSKSRAAGPYQWIEAGPAFSQSVLNLPLIRNYQIGREGVRESRAQERATREDITASVVLQYHLVLRAIAIRDTAKARVALAERLSNLAINQQQSHGDRKEATENECYREESVAHRFAHSEYSIPVRARISGSRTIPTLIDACVCCSFPRG